jgi:hypothetical protein
MWPRFQFSFLSFCSQLRFTSKALVGTSLPSFSRSQATMLTVPQPLCSFTFSSTTFNFNIASSYDRLTAFISSPLITMRPSIVACALLALAASPTLAAPIVLVRENNDTGTNMTTVCTNCSTSKVLPTEFYIPFEELVALQNPTSSENLPQYTGLGIGPAAEVLRKVREDPLEDSDYASEAQKRDEDYLVALLQALNSRSNDIFNRR